MSELSVLSRRRVLALLAAIFMAGSTRAWSKDGDSGGDSDGGGSDRGESGDGDSSGHGGGDHDSGDGDSSGPGGGDHDGDDSGGRGRGSGRGGDDDDDDDDRDDLSDQDYARRGVARGDLVPLSRVLKTVRAARPGRVVDVDLVRTAEKGAIYRVVVMGSEHDLWQVSVDARRNRILRVRRY